MKSKRKIGLISSVLLLIALISFSAVFGQDSEQSPIAVLSATSSGIEWQPQMGDVQLALTVSGPDGFDFRQVFAAGTTPLLPLMDQEENGLPDGQYSYELIVMPVLSPETQEALASVREADAETRNSLEQALILAGDLPSEVQIQSGSFIIEGSVVITGNENENDGGSYNINLPPGLSSTQIIDGPTDQQILDDLIVDGSACVGQDCVNGESFGFDTFRIKENNLRIHFQDTSSTASFPSNDWRIVINDSSNGGANYFAIEDSNAGRQPFRVDAGAPASALYVDSAGDVGLGTSTPVVEMHMADGDTPTVRLEQNGTSGWTPQTWDVAGNETNFFIRDVTNGSALPFRIEPSSPSNSIYIDSTGNIGLGTNSPTASLDVRGNDGTTSLYIGETNSTTTNRFMLELVNNGAPKIKLINSSTGVEWQFSMNSGDDFIIGETGTSGQEFLVRQDGSVKMGPGGIENFFLDANGNLTIAGTVTANGQVLTSSPVSLTNSNMDDSLETQIGEQQTEIEALQQENAQLEERLVALELLVQSLLEQQD